MNGSATVASGSSAPDRARVARSSHRSASSNRPCERTPPLSARQAGPATASPDQPNPSGELDRLAAARLGQLRLLLQVRHVREEAEAGDGDVRSSCAPCELEALAEVALCRVELHGPQLDASDADQRDRAQIVDVGPDLGVRTVEDRLGRARDAVEAAAACDCG